MRLFKKESFMSLRYFDATDSSIMHFLHKKRRCYRTARLFSSTAARFRYARTLQNQQILHFCHEFKRQRQIAAIPRKVGTRIAIL